MSEGGLMRVDLEEGLLFEKPRRKSHEITLDKRYSRSSMNTRLNTRG